MKKTMIIYHVATFMEKNIFLNQICTISSKTVWNKGLNTLFYAVMLLK